MSIRDCPIHGPYVADDSTDFGETWCPDCGTSGVPNRPGVSGREPNAIERLKAPIGFIEALSLGQYLASDETLKAARHYLPQARESAAAVDALYQAAKAEHADCPFTVCDICTALARVEGQA